MSRLRDSRFRGVSQRFRHIVGFQVGVERKDFRYGHAVSDELGDHGDGDAQPADARSAAELVRAYRDPGESHAGMLAAPAVRGAGRVLLSSGDMSGAVCPRVGKGRSLTLERGVAGE